MNLLDYSLGLFSRVLTKEITFAQAMNKYAGQLNVDNSDVTKIKDVLKSVINRYYFFKWELNEVIKDDFSYSCDYKYLSKLENIDITAYLDYKMQDIKGIEDTTSNIVGKTVSGSKKENLLSLGFYP